MPMSARGVGTSAATNSVVSQCVGRHNLAMTEFRRIHDVLAVLKPRHPNLNVSKIRYLEASGAVSCTCHFDGTRWY
jgi:hypothetical protein